MKQQSLVYFTGLFCFNIILAEINMFFILTLILFYSVFSFHLKTRTSCLIRYLACLGASTWQLETIPHNPDPCQTFQAKDR